MYKVWPVTSSTGGPFVWPCFFFTGSSSTYGTRFPDPLLYRSFCLWKSLTRRGWFVVFFFFVPGMRVEVCWFWLTFTSKMGEIRVTLWGWRGGLTTVSSKSSIGPENVGVPFLFGCVRSYNLLFWPEGKNVTSSLWDRVMVSPQFPLDYLSVLKVIWVVIISGMMEYHSHLLGTLHHCSVGTGRIGPTIVVSNWPYGLQGGGRSSLVLREDVYFRLTL